MADAIIYRPSKTAMQSGRGRVGTWVLEFEPGSPKVPDPLMGWTGSADTRRQVRLCFASREAAAAYAERSGLSFRIQEPHARVLQRRSYAENFAFTRVW